MGGTNRMPEISAMAWSGAEMWLAGFVGLVASAEDLLRRTISNWLPLTALAGGIACHALTAGWRGAGSALLGAVAGFFVFLIFYILGGMGGGDVKLMAGFGAILGIGRLLPAALLAAIFGGVLAVAVLGCSALRRRGKNAETGKAPAAIPYAPAIVMGAWLTLFSGV
ncbi:MAG: prepilin peptidase [Acidimicrobiia bacterium]|nr:prepilin peptidase [Acidimicrobiia bacterium]